VQPEVSFVNFKLQARRQITSLNGTWVQPLREWETSTVTELRTHLLGLRSKMSAVPIELERLICLVERMGA
jgi:hypothetical protein